MNKYYRSRLLVLQMDFLCRSTRNSKVEHVSNKEIRIIVEAEKSIMLEFSDNLTYIHYTSLLLIPPTNLIQYFTFWTFPICPLLTCLVCFSRHQCNTIWVRFTGRTSRPGESGHGLCKLHGASAAHATRVARKP